MTQTKLTATAVLAALVLASAGWMAAGCPEEPKRLAIPPGSPARGLTKPDPAAKIPKPVEMVEVRGRVVAPDVRPVKRATVRASEPFGDDLTAPEVVAGPDGGFTVRLPDSGVPRAGLRGRYPRLVASAPGFGPGWADRALRPDRPAEQMIRLAEAGPTIEGRFVDLEGRPLAGETSRPSGSGSTPGATSPAG